LYSRLCACSCVKQTNRDISGAALRTLWVEFQFSDPSEAGIRGLGVEVMTYLGRVSVCVSAFVTLARAIRRVRTSEKSSTSAAQNLISQCRITSTLYPIRTDL
jgi:hypothetical protein